MANLYGVHHNPEIWSEPEEFKPERFLAGKDLNLKNLKSGATSDNLTFVKNESLIPFSIGKRVCLAEVMAQTEFFLFLSGMLQNFDFKFADPNNTPNMDDVNPGLVLSPKPFKVIVTERL
jgi:cytochrome P450 family 2 subfamily U polypeptide 1